MRIALLVVVCALAFGCSTGRAPGDRADAFRPAIEAANQELMDRYNRGDKLGVARMYEDDAVMISDRGERYVGREAIDRYWDPPREPGAPPRKPGRWTLHVLSVEGTESMPIQRGRSILENEWQGQKRISDVQFLVVWRKQADGGYKIAIDAWWPSVP